ncbi:hypothetical protein B296_00035042 [Ensete ventricosum]|uniref:Uncharacterized protein n=1 Tax=Ensete ventricosum TaxID=4639 RepID=A0A426ZGS6_ENSVE|nr:hypothetical protein B296_00035042 [Ensete ventricosum]
MIKSGVGVSKQRGKRVADHDQVAVGVGSRQRLACKGRSPVGAAFRKLAVGYWRNALKKTTCGQKHLPQGLNDACPQGWPPEGSGASRRGNRPWTRWALVARSTVAYVATARP